ncbi:hypothetical protein WJX84_005416 [Apatococcus fuscideae]|uniref:Uncharacterized protein n=1 Tax=Apatococcus fuscideae TaxID=2026836 RepID=A0AAW1SXM1_9CHLO
MKASVSTDIHLGNSHGGTAVGQAPTILADFLACATCARCTGVGSAGMFGSAAEICNEQQSSCSLSRPTFNLCSAGSDICLSGKRPDDLQP